MKKATRGVGGLGIFAQPILGKPRSVSPAHPVLDKDSVQILNKQGDHRETQPRSSQKKGPDPSGLIALRQVQAGRVAESTVTPGGPL
jgi:hypothetical protein